jgi:hypothetical protein
VTPAKGKRPDIITIAPFDYAVRDEPQLQERAGVVGLCNTDTLHLYLDGGLPYGVEAETLLHETLHAMWAQTNLQKRFTDKQQEAVVWALAPRLLSLLRDNPELVKWLTNGPGR